MSNKKMTQWEYALMLRTYDENMTEQELIEMPRQALSIWIERTKVIRRESQSEENAALRGEYKELIEEQKDKLLAVAQDMTTLTKKGRFEWKGACPLCDKGKDRFIVNTRGVPFWNCRFCIEGGDTVALVAKKNSLTMWEAAEELAGWSPRDKAEVNRQRKYKIITPQSNKPKELADLTAKFGTCWQTFRENSLTAMAYFGKRGLEPLTINKNRVGMIQTVRGMAIAYPCERINDGRWQIVGVNRRFLDAEHIKEMVEKAETEKEAKKIRRDNPKTKLAYGSNWGIYRLRRRSGAIGLLVVEGEENALSVWQTARGKGWPCDVASVGSQSNFKSLKADIATLASDYQHLLIWADEQHIADKARKLYGHSKAMAISSPNLAGYDKPADANAMLMQGELSEFLAHQLKRLSAELVAQGEQALTNRCTPTNGANGHLPTNGADRHLVGTPTNGRSANGDLPNRANTSTTAPREGSRASAENDAPEILLSHVTVSASRKREAQASTNEHAPMRHLPTDITTLDTHLAIPTNRCTHSPISPKIHLESDADSQAHLPTDNKERKHPETPDTALTINKQKADTYGNDDYLTGSDSLLALCAELCDSINDFHTAERWYLVCEKHYMYGDFTSLRECYQAIRLATNKGTEPIFPELPVKRTNYDDWPDIDINNPFYRWIWAVRAVQFGNDNYLPKAWAWARQIKDLEVREEAENKMTRLFGEFDTSLQFAQISML